MTNLDESGGDGRRTRTFSGRFPQRFILRLLISFIVLVAVMTFLRPGWHATPHIGDAMNYLIASAAWMADNNCAFLPDGEDRGERAQGHPVIYIWFIALLIALTGDTVVVPHLFHALVVASLLAVCWSAWSLKRGLPLMLWLAVTPLILAQTALINLEIPNAMAIVAALLFWQRRQFTAAIVAGMLATWFKEPGVFLTPAFLVAWFIFRKREDLPWQALVAALSPAVAFGIWIVICKLTYGWFFFPTHHPDTNLFIFKIMQFYHHGLARLQFFYIDQGRGLLLLPIAWVVARERRRIVVSSTFVAALLFILAHSVYFSTCLFQMARYGLQVIPLMYIASLWSMQAWRREARWGFVALATVVMFGYNYDYQAYPNYHMRFEENLWVLDRVELNGQIAALIEEHEQAMASRAESLKNGTLKQPSRGQGKPVAVPPGLHRSLSKPYAGFISQPLQVTVMHDRGRLSARMLSGYVLTDEEFVPLLTPVSDALIQTELNAAIARGFRQVKLVMVRDRWALFFF